MAMTDGEINRIASNDKEWRRYIIKKVDKIDEHQQKQDLKINSLEVKVGIFSVIFGFISGFFGSKF